MKKGIIVFGFLVVSLSLSAMADSFNSAFDNFMKQIKGSSVCVNFQELNKRPLNPLQVEACFDFSNFLVDKACCAYGLSHVLGNRESVLDTILRGNLIFRANLNEHYTEQSIKALYDAFKPLYDTLLPVFCICLMKKQEAELAHKVTAKL